MELIRIQREASQFAESESHLKMNVSQWSMWAPDKSRGGETSLGLALNQPFSHTGLSSRLSIRLREEPRIDPLVLFDLFMD